MPEYLYQNESTGEVKGVFQTMSEPHVYSENGVEWKRVFTVPQAQVDGLSTVDPNSYQQFNQWLNKGKGGTIGDLWDASKELSEKRAEKEGRDKIKEQSLQNYSNQRGGLKHLSQANKK